MKKHHILSLLILFSLALPSSAQENEELYIQPKYRTEIKDLGAAEILKKAFDLIVEQEDKTLADHILLNEIEAPPFKEEKRALQFKLMLEKLGVDSVWIDEVGNVIALRKGQKGAKTIALDAHLDTVFPEGTDVKVRISNDTLYAPGIADDTRALAVLLRVLDVMNTLEIQTEEDILFIGSVGEEGLGDLRGVKYLFGENGPGIDSWISIDGGSIGRVNNKGLGSHRFKVSFKGQGGHSWGAFGLANPHHALGTAIDNFVEAADKFTRYGPRTSYNVGRIGGGTSINSVPFVSWMEIDMRSLSPERLDTMDQILKTAVNKALDYHNTIKRIGYPITVDIEMIGNRPSGELSMEEPIVQRAMAATAYFGKRPQLTRGSTNSNIPISIGIPAVTIGRGGTSQNAHALNEWWYNKDGHKAIQLALLLLVSESGLVLSQ